MSEPATDTDGTNGGQNLEQHWVAVLAEYWRQTDWGQFGNQKKSRADSFGERLEIAVRAGDVHGALDKLAKGLGLAAPELPTANLTPLVEHDTEALRTLRREKVWLTNNADEAVHNYFEQLDNAGAGDANEPTTTDLSDFITGEH